MATLTRNPDLDSDAGKAFEVEGDLRLEQFAHELAKAEKWRKQPSIVLFGGEPRVLHIGRSDVTVQTAIDVAAKHKPDPEWTDPDAPPADE